jgi:hypothetical protein
MVFWSRAADPGHPAHDALQNSVDQRHEEGKLRTTREVLAILKARKRTKGSVYNRVSTRYEKLAVTFLSFVLVAAVFDWLKSF